MAIERLSLRYYDRIQLNADTVVASLQPFPIRYAGVVTMQVQIDNGAGGAPSDSPFGVWEIYAACLPGTTPGRWISAEADAQLALIAPQGNTLVQSFARFTAFPGTLAWVRYRRTSGGAGNSRATLDITSW